MSVDVGINSFGRVGRAFLRHLLIDETDTAAGTSTAAPPRRSGPGA